MQKMSVVDRYVVGRHDNVFHVDFRHEPDPPPRPFPGAGSLRFATASSEVSDAPALDCAKAKVWSKPLQRGGLAMSDRNKWIKFCARPRCSG